MHLSQKKIIKKNKNFNDFKFLKSKFFSSNFKFKNQFKLSKNFKSHPNVMKMIFGLIQARMGSSILQLCSYD